MIRESILKLLGLVTPQPYQPKFPRRRHVRTGKGFAMPHLMPRRRAKARNADRGFYVHLDGKRFWYKRSYHPREATANWAIAWPESVNQRVGVHAAIDTRPLRNRYRPHVGKKQLAKAAARVHFAG